MVAAMICPCCGQSVVAPEYRALASLKMGKQEAALLGELVRVFPYGVTSSRMQDVLYMSDAKGGPNYADKVVSMVVLRLRLKLTALGWTIPDGRTEGGYKLKRI